jgi:hypothetical protein
MPGLGNELVRPVDEFLHRDVVNGDFIVEADDPSCD